MASALGGLRRTQRPRPPPQEGAVGPGLLRPALAGPGGSVVRAWRRGAHWARGAVRPEAEVRPGFGAGQCFVPPALGTRGRQCQLRPGAPAAPPGQRFQTPPLAVTHWLLGDGGPRLEGPVAAVLEAQVWRAPRKCQNEKQGGTLFTFCSPGSRLLFSPQDAASASLS